MTTGSQGALVDGLPAAHGALARARRKAQHLTVSRAELDEAEIERQLLALDVLQVEGLDDFRAAAQLYRAARRRGLTVRRTADCLIAVVCIRADRPLLHNDSDFDSLAEVSALDVVKRP